MFFTDSPFALAASLAQQSNATATFTAAVGLTASTGVDANETKTGSNTNSTPGNENTWSDQIASMLASGSYIEGEAIAIVAPDAQGSVTTSSVDANGDDSEAGSAIGNNVGAASAPTDKLLDAAETEELTETAGDIYESALDTALPDAVVEGAQLAAAADTTDSETAAVQASDVDIYTLLVKQDGMSTEQILNELACDSRVLWAEPNYTGTISDGDAATLASAAKAAASTTAAGATANDDQAEGVTPATGEVTTDVADATPYQWGYNSSANAGFGALHDNAFTVNLASWNKPSQVNSAGIVAVMDTGIDHDNPDLKDVMADMSAYVATIGGDRYGCNTTGDNGGSEDVAGHGTHCAGIVAAAWNGFGVSGAANGAKLLSVRAADETGSFSTSAALKGFDYIERAIDAGADIRVVSNSWGGEGATHSIYLAAEAVGRKGAAIVFAAGNDTWDLDVNTYTAKTQGVSDYTTVVDSAMMTGEKSSFSNWGKTTTDVFAPGSTILSTAITSGTHCTSAFLPELLANDDDRAGYSSFDGTASKEVEAWVGITQIEDQQLAATQVGKVDHSTRGYDSANGVLEVSTQELKNITDDDNCFASLKLPVDSDKLDELSNVSVAVAVSGGGATDSLGITSLMVETIDENGNVVRSGGQAGFANADPGWSTLGTSIAEAVKEKGSKLAVHTDNDGSKYIWLHIMVNIPSLDEVDGILFDCVGAGNKLVPYVYYSGTSMATPAVAGLAAVASTQMSDYKNLDASVRAAALTRILKSSVNTFNGQFKGLCTSNGMIDASKFATSSARAPQITSATLSDDEETVTIKGCSFGENAGTVTFGDKSAAVKSWTNDTVVISCPDNLVSGYLTIELTRADKEACNYAETFVFTKHVAADELPVFEESITTPDDFDAYDTVNTLAALDGSLYVFPASDLSDEEPQDAAQSAAIMYKRVWRYEIATGTWSKVADLPCALAYVSETLWNGKMLVMGSTVSDGNGGLATKKLFSYDPTTSAWTDLSDKVSSDDVPYQAALVNVGDKLLIVGGAIVTKLPADEAAAKEQGLYVNAGAYHVDTAQMVLGTDTTALTLSRNNVRAFDLATGKVTVIGSCSPRCNTGLLRSKSDIQTAVSGNKLYVMGGAVIDPVTADSTPDQETMDCLTIEADGAVTQTSLGAYETLQTKETLGALPVALNNYRLCGALTAGTDGPVLTGLISVSGFDEMEMPTTQIVQADTYQLSSGGTAFTSIGKRINYTPTIYTRAITYRGKLYVLGHDFNGSFETVMRATALKTDELPGDVSSKNKGNESENGNKSNGGKENSDTQRDEEKASQKESATSKKSTTTATRVLPKTGDITMTVALTCMVIGAAALALARKARR